MTCSCGVHCVLEGDLIPSVDRYKHALEQECHFSVVFCDSWDAPANLMGQFYGRILPCVSCLNCKLLLLLLLLYDPEGFEKNRYINKMYVIIIIIFYHGSKDPGGLITKLKAVRNGYVSVCLIIIILLFHY